MGNMGNPHIKEAWSLVIGHWSVIGRNMHAQCKFISLLTTIQSIQVRKKNSSISCRRISDCMAFYKLEN